MPLILLPFITMSLDALTLILPLPSIVMSLPLIAIVPSFFIVMLALPVLIVIESPAIDDQVLADLQRVVLADRSWRVRPSTLRASSLPTRRLVTFLPAFVDWLPSRRLVD